LDTLIFVFLSVGCGTDLEGGQSRVGRAGTGVKNPREENPNRSQVFGTVFASFL
jgi:hypothetical protein